jgi:hypothetical protein
VEVVVPVYWGLAPGMSGIPGVLPGVRGTMGVLQALIRSQNRDGCDPGIPVPRKPLRPGAQPDLAKVGVEGSNPFARSN